MKRVKPQFSTAFSDFVLALATWYLCLKIFENGSDEALPFELGSFVVIATAASVGFFRFGVFPNSKSVVNLHTLLSALGSQSVSMLSLCFWTYEDGASNRMGRLLWSCGILALLAFVSFVYGQTYSDIIEPLDVIVGGLSLIAAIYKAYILLWPCTLAVSILCGALFYITAGLLIGVKGEMFGIPRVDIFHYVLVVANLYYATAVIQMGSA